MGVGILGCGAWGQNHARVWDELGELRAVCDPDPARLETIRSRHPDVETVDDAARLLAHPDVDAVVVATPAAIHVTLAAQALESGKDVLVEKPMALDVEGGRGLVALAERLDRVLMVGQVLEFHPAAIRLEELLRSGRLGRLRYLYANRVSLGRVRTEENALWSFAPHDVALMLRLAGGLPEEVSCVGGAYLNPRLADVTVTHLRFPGGARGHIHVSWLHPFKEHRVVVIGDRAMAVLDDTAPWPEKLTVFEHAVALDDAGVPVARKAAGIAEPVEAAEPLRRECEAFLEAVRTRRTGRADGRSGVAVLQVLAAAQRSLDRGGAPGPLSARAASIHPTAEVDPGAEVGEAATIWHHAQVMAGARVGRGSVVGRCSFIGSGAVVGDDVRMQSFVSMSEGAEVEDRVFIGPSVAFTNVRTPRAEIDRSRAFQRILVREGATIGANAVLVCPLVIGRYAMVAAGAVVTRDVPDHALVVGAPARPAGWSCVCGERLPAETLVCASCGRGFRREGAGLAPR